MSMTLILWKAPAVDDPDEAKRLLEPWYDSEDDSAFEPSPDIAIVADELRRLYPYWPVPGEELVGGMSEEERSQYTEEGLAQLRESGSYEQDEDGPWADLPFEQTAGLLELSIRWSANDKAIDDILRLAREQGLVLYDPQGPDVTLPTDPIDTGPTAPPTLRDWLGVIAIAAFLCALTYAAWLIPIDWLKWPAVVIAGFFAAAGLFVVGAMIAGALGIVDPDEGRTSCVEDEPPL